MFKICHPCHWLWRTPLFFRRHLLVSSLLIGIASAPAATVLDLLPTNCCAFVTVPTTTGLRPVLNASALGIFRAPALKPLGDHIGQCWSNSAGDDFQQILGLERLLRTVPGSLTLAAMASMSPTNQTLGWLLVLDSGSNSNASSSWLTAQRQIWQLAGTVHKEQIAGCEFLSINLTNRDFETTKLWQLINAQADSPTEPPRILVGQRGSMLLFSPSSNVLASVLSTEPQNNRLTPPRRSGDAAAWGWCDIRKTQQILSASQRLRNAGTGLSRLVSLASAAGFGGFESFGFSLRTNSAGVLFEARLPLSKSYSTNLPGLFSESDSAVIPAFVSENAECFQQWHFTGDRLWTSIEYALNRASGQAKRGLDFLLETAEIAAQTKRPEFNLRTNLVTNIGDELSYWQQPGTNSSGKPERIIVIRSPNPEELAYTIKSMLILVSADAEKPQEREFLHRRVYSIALPAANLAGLFTIPQNTTLHYAYNTQYMAIATGPSILEDFLRRAASATPGLGERAGLTNSLAALIPHPALLYYQNDRALLKRNWADIQSDPANLLGVILPEPALTFIRPFLPCGDPSSVLKPELILAFPEVETHFSYHINSVGIAEEELCLQSFYPYLE